MSRRAGMWAATVLLSAAVACGDGPRGPATLEDAHAELRSEIDGVAREALGHLRWRPEPSTPPALCDTAAGAVSSRAGTASHGLEAELRPGPGGPVAAAVAAEWRERDYGSVKVEPGGGLVTARRDGMLFELVVDSRGGRAFLGGSTACLPLRGGG